ncbi:hypothetical protein AURDEDRAFT_163424 [Auricularia subglabra TFB-10046 SS5]|nr:hypothetical protein AURDEDRAFT_163424 [Auricularia subglabra TFB-10046 SS5]
MPSDRVYQPIQQPSVQLGMRVRFVYGGREYAGTVSGISINTAVMGGIVVTVAVDNPQEIRTVPLCNIRPL